MLLFGKRDRKIEVQRLLTKIINANCSAINALREGPRGEQRLNLTLVVILVPEVDGQPDVARAFTTVTKEISSSGVSLILRETLDIERLVLAFEVEGEMKFCRGEIRHQGPMGGGLVQAGLRLVELVSTGDYPALAHVRI